jgi:uncharacterized protein (DUF1499 family)
MKNVFLYIAGAAIILSIAFALRFWSMGRQSKLIVPALGVKAGMLLPCDEKPNCVSSSSTPGQEAYIAPLSASEREPIARIRNYLLLQKGYRVVEESENYLRMEFTSRVFKFVDDLEFYWDGQNPQVAVRSSSRVGYSDLGANRKRIEAIRVGIRAD